MSKADAIKEQLAMTRYVVDSTTKDITPDACAQAPGGKAHNIGATYAHLVMSEDFIVQGLCKGGAPLAMSSFAGKTGASEPMPMPGGDVYAWASSVKVDLSALKEYEKAVRAATDEYLSSASDDDLSATVDFGGRQTPKSVVVGLAAIIHPSNHIGEISALKGVFGDAGYGF